MRRRPLRPHLKRWFNRRTGKVYLQFRKRGHQAVPLPQPIGSDEFWQAYNAALKGKIKPGADARSIAGSVSAAIAAYYASFEWERWRKARGARRPILERFREKYGQWPLRQMDEDFLTAYLTWLRPHAARNHLQALRALLRHASTM